MNERELREYLDARKPTRHERFDTGPLDTLPCVGCAHSAAGAPYPGHPSGERPCCSCVRNPDREKWAAERAFPPSSIVVGTDGVARIFDPYVGTLYNGAPRPSFPSDNYVTLDQRDQERFLDAHPEYAKPVQIVNGVPRPVE
jgi:hypothetical protein